MDLEYGRKVLPHLFKRNNYRTMTIGKPQPVEDSLKDPTNTRVSTVYTEGIECKLPGGA